jgi:predicted  nucleic acid-binding Zn-ribbon protein
MQAANKTSSGTGKEKTVSRSEHIAILEKRVADLGRKLKTAQRESKKLQDRVSDLVEWGTTLSKALNVLVEKIDDRLTQLINANDHLFSMIEGPDDRPTGQASLKSSLGALADRGETIPVDGNAAGIFKRPIS